MREATEMSIPSLSLAGKVAIVTGSSKGIGRGIALLFAEAGADVVVCSRGRDDSLEKVAREIRKLGRRSLAVPADISKKADVERLVQKTVAEFGTIDILVNNAAVIKFNSMMDLTEEDWDRFLNIDLKGYFLCSQAVARIMIDRKRGNIINVASTASFKPLLERGAYSIVKSGVAMLTRLFAKELASCNIRVNALAPGFVKTEFTRPLWASDPEFLKKHEAKIPMGRSAEMAEMSQVVLFLASDLSSYMTGSIVVADGGFLLL
jgi:NAD(P)-dependent dehydrogenase (short-subunit alcohol dehydrogenase family)